MGESNTKLLQSFILGHLNLLKSKQSDGDLADDVAEGQITKQKNGVTY